MKAEAFFDISAFLPYIMRVLSRRDLRDLVLATSFQTGSTELNTETSITSLERLGQAWKEFAKHCPDQTGHLASFSNTVLAVAQKGWGDVYERRAIATSAVWHLSGAMHKLLEVEKNPPLGAVRLPKGRVFQLQKEGIAALRLVAEAQIAAAADFPCGTGDNFNNAARGLAGCNYLDVDLHRFHRAMMVYMMAWSQLTIL